MPRDNEDSDWLPPDERRERRAAAASSSASRREDRSAYQQDFGEFGTSALASFNQLVRDKLAANELRDDLFSTESQVRGMFNSMASYVGDCKQAIVDFLNVIPDEEKVFSDSSLLTQLFSDIRKTDSKKRPANSLKTKFSLRYLCLTSIGNHIGSENWTVESFNDMLVQSNPHFRDHAAFAFDVFVSAVVSSKGAPTNKGVRSMVPYFSGLTDDQFNSLAIGYAQYQRTLSQRTGGRRSGPSGARHPVSTLVSSSTVESHSVPSPESPLGGLGMFPDQRSDVQGISMPTYLDLLKNCEKENYIFPVYIFDAERDPVNIAVDVTDWKKSDSDYWTNFSSSIESLVGTRPFHSVTQKMIDGVPWPFITARFAPPDSDLFQIDVDCGMVVRMIAPHVGTVGFMCNEAHTFTDTEQQTAESMFSAIFSKNVLWIEILGWFKRGMPFLTKRSVSGPVGRDGSWPSGDFFAELDDLDESTTSTAALVTGTSTAATLATSTSCAAVSSAETSGAAVSSAESSGAAALAAESSDTTALAAESSSAVAVVAGGLPDRAPAAGDPSVASVDTTHVGGSDTAVAGSTSAREVADGVESGEGEVELRDPSTDLLERDSKRRKTDDDGAVPCDIMDAISLFDRQCIELRTSLVKILSDDGHLAELKDNLNKQKGFIDEQLEKIDYEKTALNKFCEQVIRDKAIIKSEMEENRRILTELRQAQAVSRERILKSQGILQDFCAFSTDIITVELKEAEKTAVESVEICKSISAAVKLFNGDKTEAEQNLKAVQEDLQTKRGEQTGLDQRLTSLRDEAATAERVLEALRRDEDAAKERIAALRADEEDRNIRIAAQNATLGINSSTITAQNGELNELKEKIMKHNVHLRNIQKYKEEYPKMVARMRDLDTKEAELAAREQALLRRSSGLALATPLDSVSSSQLGSIPSVAGASGTAGAAAGGSPDEALELGSGEARRPGL